jgi:hypothetical protein
MIDFGAVYHFERATMVIIEEFMPAALIEDDLDRAGSIPFSRIYRI